MLVLLSLLLLLSLPAASAEEYLPGPYNAEVTEVVDGDTIRARVKVWLGLTQETLVRLEDIDTPELRGKCEQEKALAKQAKEHLRRLLVEQGNVVRLTDIHPDKYGGRIDAKVTTTGGASISEALIKGGYGRPYQGEQRGSWCP